MVLDEHDQIAERKRVSQGGAEIGAPVRRPQRGIDRDRDGNEALLAADEPPDVCSSGHIAASAARLQLTLELSVPDNGLAR